MTDSPSVRIRHNQAIVAAAVIAFFGTMPLAGARWYLLPLLLVPLAVDRLGLACRHRRRPGRPAGTRAASGSATCPGPGSARSPPTNGAAAKARLVDGTVVALPAVRRSDLPALAAASGNPLPAPEPEPETEPAQ